MGHLFAVGNQLKVSSNRSYPVDGLKIGHKFQEKE